MSTSNFYLELVTPEGRVFNAPVDMVELPTMAGELGIYPGHVPLLADVSVGELRIHTQTEIQYYALAGGYVQIFPSFMRIVASFACAGEDETQIDVACRRAQTALEQAQAEDPALVAAELRDLRRELVVLSTHKKRQNRI
jgi:F-type H+-transporting ATPase subunit epsilon